MTSFLSIICCRFHTRLEASKKTSGHYVSPGPRILKTSFLSGIRPFDQPYAATMSSNAPGPPFTGSKWLCLPDLLDFLDKNDVFYFYCGVCAFTTQYSEEIHRCHACCHEHAANDDSNPCKECVIWRFEPWVICWSCERPLHIGEIMVDEYNIEDQTTYMCPYCGYKLDSAWLLKWKCVFYPSPGAWRGRRKNLFVTRCDMFDGPELKEMAKMIGMRIDDEESRV